MVFTVQNPPRRSQRYHRNAEVNITNLMDVMMVLLVVFMVAAPLMKMCIRDRRRERLNL